MMTSDEIETIRARIDLVPWNTGIGCALDGITYYAHGRSDDQDRALIDTLSGLKEDVPRLLDALAAQTARAEAAEHLAKRMAGLLETTMPQLHAMKSHNTGAPVPIADCTWGLCHLHRELIGKAQALTATPFVAAAGQEGSES